MYHCHIRFYLMGRSRAFDIIKGMSPLEHFTHEFSESRDLKKELASKADVILAAPEDNCAEDTLRTLISDLGDQTELILLVSKEQTNLLKGSFGKIKDIWTLPMSDEEVRFRFLRWQQSCMRDKDAWQTSHYLEATINNIPSMIWYKDKDGVHEKVNDSFCKTVNKTKEQVQGRRHAYIWDVEQDDPACIESERQVMESQRTVVSEETVMTGEGTRLLTTYKSPLYDLDGSVMGTVGVGIDITQERAYEQEIIRKNRTLEEIFMTMDCGVMCHSLDGSRILSVNRAALKILGYDSQEELLADGFDMIAKSVLDEDKEKLREHIQRLKKEGDSISVEYRVLHQNGDILHVMGNVKLVKENGEPFYQRFLLDITEQKLAEKRKERRHMELVHALSIEYELVCFFDLHTGLGMPLRVADHTEHFAMFSGEKLSLEESMRLYIQDQVYEDDKETLRQASLSENLEKELEKKNTYYINYRTSRNGRMEYFQMKAVRAGEWDENHGIALGFRSVDEEIRGEMEQKSLLEDAL